PQHALHTLRCAFAPAHDRYTTISQARNHGRQKPAHTHHTTQTDAITATVLGSPAPTAPPRSQRGSAQSCAFSCWFIAASPHILPSIAVSLCCWLPLCNWAVLVVTAQLQRS